MKNNLALKIATILFLPMITNGQEQKGVDAHKLKLLAEMEKINILETKAIVEDASSFLARNWDLDPRFEVETVLALRRLANVEDIDKKRRQLLLEIDQRDTELFVQAFSTPIAKKFLLTLKESEAVIKNAAIRSFQQNYGSVFGEKYSVTNPIRPPEVGGITKFIWNYFPETKMCYRNQ